MNTVQNADKRKTLFLPLHAVPALVGYREQRTRDESKGAIAMKMVFQGWILSVRRTGSLLCFLLLLLPRENTNQYQAISVCQVPPPSLPLPPAPPRTQSSPRIIPPHAARSLPRLLVRPSETLTHWSFTCEPSAVRRSPSRLSRRSGPSGDCENKEQYIRGGIHWKRKEAGWGRVPRQRYVRGFWVWLQELIYVCAPGQLHNA